MLPCRSKHELESAIPRRQHALGSRRPALPLQELLDDGAFPVVEGGRVLVPGAGRGHCALHLARLGYDVDALDVADRAVELASESAVELGLEERARFHMANLFEVPGAALRNSRAPSTASTS
jgi:2-polyprenyl-3-methyl-5-hydroxy-6-metoxy-1,4-benzoquinol methylase